MPSAARPATALVLALLLAGCARHHRAVAAADHAAPHPPRPVLEPRYASVTPPPRDADGGYRTINSGLDSEQTVWHVRAALNVAAIGCRGPADAGTVSAYNTMLSSKKKLLADANKAFLASFRAAGASDTYMTRLYNFFAMPAAKPAFCAAAADLAPKAAAAPAADFPAFAESALPALEAPFDAVYRAVDAYRTASAAWEARYGPGAAPPIEVADSKTRHRASPTPRLAYADLGRVIAWQPALGERYASR